MESHKNENTYMILQNKDQAANSPRKRNSRPKDIRNKLPSSTKVDGYYAQLEHLTKIMASDYIGKDICRLCHKTVGKVQK